MNSFEDADRIINTLRQFWLNGKEPPKEYLEEVKRELNDTYGPIKRYFYDVLTERCPDMLKYF